MDFGEIAAGHLTRWHARLLAEIMTAGIGVMTAAPAAGLAAAIKMYVIAIDPAAREAETYPQDSAATTTATTTATAIAPTTATMTATDLAGSARGTASDHETDLP